MLRSLYNDRVFLLALLLAVVTWSGLWWLMPPQVSVWSWPVQQPLVFFQLVLLYPVLEELSFRGLIQGWLARRFGGELVTAGALSLSKQNLVTSALFVLFHFMVHSVYWSMAVMLPSLVFGYFRDRYNSVIPAVVLHVFYNGGYFLLYPPL